MTVPSHEFLGLQSALAGEYSLQRELGRGGMGIVYLARDVQGVNPGAGRVRIALVPPFADCAEALERIVACARRG